MITNHFDPPNDAGGFMPIGGIPSGAQGTHWVVSEVGGGWSG